MTYKEKILFTFCAYLHQGFGATKFKALWSDESKKVIKDPFEYLKDNFSDEIPHVAEFLQELNKHQIKYICQWEETYPSGLRRLPNPPIILFYKGNISLLQKEIIAIIGTRKCSEQGAQYAKTFSTELSLYYVIASGLAFGIDSIANRMSSQVENKSIVVVPGSLVKPHPYTNNYVYERVLNSGGLALSEFPLLDTLEKYSFVVRNRILSGISKNILLIESPLDGGSMITCKISKSISSQIYAIPANIELNSFKGNNHLIKTSVAQLVTESADILRDNNKLFFSNKPYNLNPEEQLIIETLSSGCSFDTICIKLKDKIPFDKVYDIMLNLELDGIITRNISGQYTLN